MKIPSQEPKFRLLATKSDRLTLTLLSDLLPQDMEIRLADSDHLLADAEDWQPDVIVLNYEQRYSTGIELCRELRALPRLRDVPILIITACDSRQARHEAVDAGADAYIVKPFDIEDVELRMRAILRANRYRRLLAVQKRFELMAEQSPQGIVLCDANNRVTFVNKMAKSLLALDAGSLESWPQQLAERFTARPAEAWERLYAGELPEQLLLLEKTNTREGSLRWFSCQPSSLGESDGSYIVLINEVTRVAERQNLLWGIRSLVSHKLRTPVNGLLAPIEILMSEDLSPEAHSICEVIQTSATRLADTVANIENYFQTSGEVGGGDCTVGRFSELLRSVASEFGVRAPRINMHGIQDCVMLMHERNVRLILTELMENSKKFHPQNDPNIQANAIALSRERIRIDLSDDGKKLSLGHLRRLHLPFYQAEDTPTGELQGEGLGLAQVARVVWEHGGSIRFTNREDASGLCVTMELPLNNGVPSS